MNKPIVLNGLYSAGRSLLRPMVMHALAPFGYESVDWSLKRDDINYFKKIPDKTIIHGHFLVGDDVGYEQLLTLDYKHLFLYRDFRDLLVSGMNYDRNSDNTKGREINRILNQFTERDALKYILNNQVEDKNKYFLFRLRSFIHTTRECLWRENVFSTSFERLKTQPEQEMDLLLKFLNINVSQKELVDICNKGSFKLITGRNPGNEDKRSARRKGVAGDWKNYFDPELKCLFKNTCGDILCELGYEPNNDW